MRTGTKTLFAVFVALATLVGLPSSVVPLARAVTACEDAGYDPAFCDQKFLEALDRYGIPYSDPAAAIRVGHGVADYLARHPTSKGITTKANGLIRDNASVNFTVQQAVNFIHIAVHYYGPPGLEQTLDSL